MSNRDVLSHLRERALRDHARVYDVVEDTSTTDVYDTKEVDQYDGKASVHTDSKALRRTERGDKELDADAVVVLLLVEDTVEDSLLDAHCEATFRGQTRTGRVTETRRREVTVVLVVEWA